MGVASSDPHPGDLATSGDVWRARVVAARRRLDQGEPAVAVELLKYGAIDAPVEAQSLLATALRRLGRTAEALPILQRLAELRPLSAVAEHNLAAALGDLNQMDASEAAARRSIAKGGGAAETWLVMGRALAGLGRLEEAEAAYQFALRLRPDHLEALRDLAQLEWMRTGCTARLHVVLEPLRRLARGSPVAAANLGGILHSTLGPAAALEALTPWLAQARTDPLVALALIGPATEVDPPLALELSRQVLAHVGRQGEAQVAHSCALIACDQPAAAREILLSHLERYPADRAAQGLLEAARRMLGHAEALGPDDYQRVVRAYPLFPELEPEAVDARLEAIAGRLAELHPFVAPPFGQSIRGGAQSRLDPRSAGDPLIEDLFQRLQAPIASYIEAQAGSLEPPRAWRLAGAWSVRLRAGDRHVDHIHPGSWLSSALYIDLPPDVEDGGRQGWLRFGAAPIGGGRTLSAQHWVRPVRGWLVLFPSWLWHGTEPFTGEGDRLSVAFNVDRED